MRPGRARPGCCGPADACIQASPPGFNEAGARAPRMPPRTAGRPGRASRASMRPGRARPGCAGRRTTTTRPCRCFNEAGARAPRMRRSAPQPSMARTSFNEAGARAPRMHRLGRQGAVQGAGASMRPGRARPGCSPSPARRNPRRSRFNEAGARAPRMRARLLVDEAVRRAASMRPGRARPGCRHHTTCWRPRQNPVDFERFGNFHALGIPLAPRVSWLTPGISHLSTCCAVSSGSRNFCVASPLEPTRRKSQ